MRGMISQGNCHAPLRYPEPEPPKELQKVDSIPIEQLPCQIAGGSVQYFLSKALPETGLKLRGNSHGSAPDRMLFINGTHCAQAPLLFSNVHTRTEWAPKYQWLGKSD